MTKIPPSKLGNDWNTYKPIKKIKYNPRHTKWPKFPSNNQNDQNTFYLWNDQNSP